jgi:hypothetical protein
LRLARTPAGDLHILIADIKSSTAVKVEHRLQVACYAETLTALLDACGIPVLRTRYAAFALSGASHRGA